MSERNGVDPIDGLCNDHRALWPDVEAIDTWCTRRPGHEMPHRSGDVEWTDSEGPWFV